MKNAIGWYFCSEETNRKLIVTHVCKCRGEVSELKGFAVIVLVLRSLLFFCFEGVEEGLVFCAANFVETHLYTSSGLIICALYTKVLLLLRRRKWPK